MISRFALRDSKRQEVTMISLPLKEHNFCFLIKLKLSSLKKTSLKAELRTICPPHKSICIEYNSLLHVRNRCDGSKVINIRAVGCCPSPNKMTVAALPYSFRFISVLIGTQVLTRHRSRGCLKYVAKTKSNGLRLAEVDVVFVIAAVKF